MISAPQALCKAAAKWSAQSAVRFASRLIHEPSSTRTEPSAQAFQFSSFLTAGSRMPLLRHSILFLLLSASAFAQQPPQARLDSKHRAFLKDYCIDCHRAGKEKGKVRLDDIAFTLDSVARADLWQKVLNQVNSGEMPPEDEKQPDKLAKTDFLEALSGTLVTARQSLGDVHGKITMRRLNRREYKNTIRDLLGVDLRVNELPADGGAGSFDTVGSSLFMSSDQFEQYLALGRQALDEHFARFVTPPPSVPRLMHAEAEEKNAKIAKALAARLDDRQRYEKWTAAVEAAAQRPENAEAAAKVRAEKKNDPTHLYSQWRRIQGAPSPTDFGFVDEVNADMAGRRDWLHYVPHHRAYVQHPLMKTGAFLTVEDVMVNPYQAFRLPGDWPAGDYVVRVRIAATKDTPASRHFVEFGSQHDSGVRAVISSHQVTGTVEKPQVLEIPLRFSPENGRGFFFQEKGSYESENAARQVFEEAKKRNGVGPEFALWIDWIEVASKDATLAAAAPQTFKARTEAEVMGNRRMNSLFKRTKEQHDNHARWAAAVDAAAARPENLKIAAELREKAKKPRPASGVPYATPLFFYFDWEQIKGAPPPTDFGFKDAQQAFFEEHMYENYFPYYADYQKLPARDTGAWLLFYQAYREEYVSAGPKWPAGKYTLRMRVAANPAAPRERHFIEVGQRGEDVSAFTVLGAHQVTGTLAQPQIIETTVEVKADGSREFAVREKRPNSRQAEVRLYHDEFEKSGHGPPPAIWVDWLELEGPAHMATAPVAARTIKEHREVELHANAMVGGTYKGYYVGGEKAAQEFLATGKPQKGIPDINEAKFRVKVFKEHGPSFERYLNDPLTKTGAFLTIFNLHEEEVITLPPDQPSGWLRTKHELPAAAPGEYVLRFRIGAVQGTPAERHFVELGSRIEKEDFTLMKTFQISGTTDAPQTIELPVSISAQGPRTFVLREKRDVKLDRDVYDAARKATGVGPPSALWIDWVEWEGPLHSPQTTPEISPVLLANAKGVSESEHARACIAAFAQRAFRGRAPTAVYLDKLCALYETRRRAGDTNQIALKTPLSAVLASPHFLYLVEPGQEQKPRLLDATELATRLSYFLWSAPPDDTLLAHARSGALAKPDVLAQEVARMLASPKADAFVSGFVHQWLGMERLDFFQFDTRQFRDFDESARAAARQEVYETFAHLLRNHGSLSRLLKSDEIFINGLLATYYGIEGVSGDEFQKVKLQPGSPRGGLLGMAAILAMGSNGERTSPVERGAWVLRKLLHAPPPPAPPNVPQLTRLEGKVLSTRERLLAHQEEAQCLQCHRKIDPIGFGLENFNAAGKWRTEESQEKKGAGGKTTVLKTWPIDPSGAFYNGPAFADYYQLRDLIATRSGDFAKGYTEALIEYALGRPCGFTDQALVARILTRAQAKEYELSEFIRALVTSPEFQRK